MICSAEQCGRPAYCRGMCSRHYRRWREENPDKANRPPAGESAEQRFWRQVEGANVKTCWLWTGRPAKDGYGKFAVRGKSYQAHRFAYENLVAEVPVGLDLDHLCRTRACVNPWHLEPVTRRVNNLRIPPELRARGKHRTHPLETHCANGHERTEANTYHPPSGKFPVCRPCNAAAQQRRKARLRDRQVSA